MSRSGSAIQVSASFQKIPRLVGRLGSGVWVSASFQIFALTGGWENVLGGEGNCLGRRGKGPGDMSERIMSRGKCLTLAIA